MTLVKMDSNLDPASELKVRPRVVLLQLLRSKSSHEVKNQKTHELKQDREECFYHKY